LRRGGGSHNARGRFTGVPRSRKKDRRGESGAVQDIWNPQEEEMTHRSRSNSGVNSSKKSTRRGGAWCLKDQRRSVSDKSIKMTRDARPYMGTNSLIYPTTMISGKKK